MLSLREWTAVLAAGLMLLIGSEVYAQSSAEANAINQQTQGSVGTQTATTSAIADQGQVQNQSTSSSGGSVSDSGNVRISGSFNGAAPIRYLPVPSAIPMENYQPAIFGNVDYSDKGPNFISMRQLVAAMNLVDLNVKVEGAKKIRILTQMMGVAKKPEKPGPTPKSSKEKREKAKIKFEINDGEAVNHGFMPIATLSVETKTADKSNSASLAIAIGKEAQRLGASRVIFLTEGSSKEMRSSGWGIGLSYNYATVDSKPSGAGSVGSGGTGYSQGKAGYKNLIYLTAIIGN